MLLLDSIDRQSLLSILSTVTTDGFLFVHPGQPLAASSMLPCQTGLQMWRDCVWHHPGHLLLIFQIWPHVQLLKDWLPLLPLSFFSFL